MKWILVALLSATFGNQSALFTWTREKCDADLAVWQGENTALGYRNLSVEQLTNRNKELLYCELDYPDAPEKPKWIQQRAHYSDAMALRYERFLERHKLWNQFLQEDENGER